MKKQTQTQTQKQTKNKSKSKSQKMPMFDKKKTVKPLPNKAISMGNGLFVGNSTT